MLNIKRVYEKAEKNDGVRILIDRLWPRGLSKEKARIDIWLKEIAPSDQLRHWFSHDPGKWGGFKKRYFKELGGKQELVSQILQQARKAAVTLLYGAKEGRYNNAVALQEYLKTRIKD